jgi:hypothetical protein
MLRLILSDCEVSWCRESIREKRAQSQMYENETRLGCGHTPQAVICAIGVLKAPAEVDVSEARHFEREVAQMAKYPITIRMSNDDEE